MNKPKRRRPVRTPKLDPNRQAKSMIDRIAAKTEQDTRPRSDGKPGRAV